MRSTIPVRQTATFVSLMAVFPERSASRPYTETVRLVNSDFFGVFQVPFEYGRPWDRTADAKAEQVLVIDHGTNEKLFGGANSVGRRLRLGNREFTIVGVLAPWRPFVKMYDLTAGW